MGKEKIYPPFDGSQLPELFHKDALVAGVDEVGRGALFGPVVAASVVLPVSALPELTAIEVKDSKLLSIKKRMAIAEQIKAIALDWNVGYSTVAEIEQVNILQASLLAMKRAVTKLDVMPNVCLVDGRFPIPELSVPQVPLIKGDLRSPVIAAASIVAKVWRDELVMRWAQKYPEYGLAANKGYGTEQHRLALQKYGASDQHRKSFRPCQGR